MHLWLKEDRKHLFRFNKQFSYLLNLVAITMSANKAIQLYNRLPKGDYIIFGLYLKSIIAGLPDGLGKIWQDFLAERNTIPARNSCKWLTFEIKNAMNLHDYH